MKAKKIENNHSPNTKSSINLIGFLKILPLTKIWKKIMTTLLKKNKAARKKKKRNSFSKTSSKRTTIKKIIKMKVVLFLKKKLESKTSRLEKKGKKRNKLKLNNKK